MERQPNGRFAVGNKGRPPDAHRKRGSINKLTRDIKNGVVDAAISHGEDGSGKGGLPGFFRFLLKKDLRAYVHLVGKILPTQFVPDAPTGTISQVTIVAVPSGMQLSKAQIAELQPGLDPKLIDSSDYEPTH